ncbi:zinc finger and SCAN domain-containing protein 5B-like [Sus scrofa]|uniref:zinc finger and SCAN domain-containing protein 5B-like n=1 Tax=Sus scrofa TaxID=9823 RepID=UPI0003AEF61C|nr:zinc finger and SCAN domain-containing protein 5B-like [Sus scrofa]
MAEEQTLFQGPESKPPGPVPRQGTLAEKPDSESETWHVRFRTFISSKESNPIQDLRRLRELCHLWLRPDLHTKEQIMDRLVLEQFMICMPLECQVLVKESGVESCQELEDMLINQQKPKNCTIVHVGGQDFLVRGSDVDTVEAEARDMDDERALCKEPLSSVSEIHAENGQQESQELQNFPDVQEPARGQDKKGFLPATIPDPRVREGRTPKENMEQDLVEDKEDTRTPTQSQEPELRKGPETEEPTAGGNRGESVRRLTRSKRRRASSLTSQEGLQEGAPSLDTGRCSGQPQTSSACSAGRVKTTSHAKGKEAPGGTDYQCRECNKRFHYRSQFTLHKRTHTGERPFQCSLCAKAFMQPSDLRVHQRIHTGEKPYRCDTCSRDFTHDSTLRAHKRTHTKERPFPCEQCDMAFSHRGNLNVHRRTHSGLKPYVCPECHGAFRQLGTFKRHQKTHLKDISALDNVYEPVPDARKLKAKGLEKCK